MSSSFVVSTLLGVTVATALGLAAATLARKRRAALRHVLLMAALGVSLWLPVFAAVMPPVRIAVPIASAVELVGPAAADVGALEMNVASTIAEPQGLPQVSPRFPWPSLSAVALGVWLAGALLVVAPVWAGLRQMRWLRRTALPWRRGQINRRRSCARREHSAARRRAAARDRRRSRHLRRPSRRDPPASRRRVVVQGGPRPGARARARARAASRLADAMLCAGTVRVLLVPSAGVDHPAPDCARGRACLRRRGADSGRGRDGGHRVRGPTGRFGETSVCRRRTSRCSRWRIDATSRRASARCSMPSSRAGAPARSCSPPSRRRRWRW